MERHAFHMSACTLLNLTLVPTGPGSTCSPVSAVACFGYLCRNSHQSSFFLASQIIHLPTLDMGMPVCQSSPSLAPLIPSLCVSGLQVAILAMGAPEWEVRNAASLCFGALILRTVGFKNLAKGESSKRAITGAEFFQRYPALHTFLLGQLKEAAQGLEQGGEDVHPSLSPVLVLLSRLRWGGAEVGPLSRESCMYSQIS